MVVAGGENDDRLEIPLSDFLARQKAGRFQENDSLDEHACVILFLRVQKVKPIHSSASTHACLDISILQMILT
jgi:hypothetical protein